MIMTIILYFTGGRRASSTALNHTDMQVKEQVPVKTLEEKKRDMFENVLSHGSREPLQLCEIKTMLNRVRKCVYLYIHIYSLLFEIDIYKYVVYLFIYI